MHGDAQTPGTPPGDATQPTQPATTVPEAGLPRRIGRYEVRGRLGGGGMGDVYEAVQHEPRRVVALKVLRASLQADALARFRAEAEILGRFSHPAIAQVFEADTHDDGHVPFIAMEHVPGARPITEYAGAHRLSVSQRLGLFARVCRAVHHAHSHGVIHRDLKPGNILVGSDGSPKVIDFGVARFAGLNAAGPTRVGQVVGTLRYMSPEQVEGDPYALDERTDVYSLGVVLYELLCGRSPYELAEGGFTEAARTIQRSPPLRPRRANAEIDPDAEAIVLGALEKDRALRYAGAGEMAEDIERHLRGEAVRAARIGPARRAASRARAFSRRHPWMTLLACAAAAWTVGIVVIGPLLYATPVMGWCLALLPRPAVGPAPRFDAVRIVGIADDTDMAALAAAAGVEGIGNDEAALRSWRRMHGRLLERLAESGLAVAAIDLQFGDAAEHEVPYDEAFVAGAAALARRAPVVLGIDGWGWAREDPPPSSRTIARAIPLWGSISLFQQSETGEQFAALAGQVRGADPMPSLSLRTFACMAFPGADVRYRMDPLGQWVEVRGERGLTLNPSVRVPSGPPVRVPVSLSDQSRRSANPGEDGLPLRLAWHHVRMPSDQECASMIIPYQRVWEADSQTLRGWFRGRAVILAETRSGRDDCRAADGRTLPAALVHAAALAQLLASPRAAGASSLAQVGATAAAAIVGSLIGFRTRGRALVILAAGLTGLGIAGSLWLSAAWGYLWEPVSALATAGVGAALARRLRVPFAVRRRSEAK